MIDTLVAPRILLVEAPYYTEIAEPLAAGAMRVLTAVDARVERVSVHGAFEIPAAIGLARSAFDGFIALGCVIRGETHHFNIVADQSAAALMRLAVEDKIALGNGILTVEDRAQAVVRADPDGKDYGGAAAKACLQMIALKRRFLTGGAE
ncbi:MAG: 6,7-dimethyl-8-ribityllumazine synthase [Pseudomonadota bacterium]